MKSIFYLAFSLFCLTVSAQEQSISCLLNEAICLKNGQFKLEKNICNFSIYKGTPQYSKSFLFSNPKEVFTLEIETLENENHDLDFAVYSVSGTDNSEFIRLNLNGRNIGSRTKKEFSLIQGLSTNSNKSFIDSGFGSSSFLKAIEKSDQLYLLVVFSKSDKGTFRITHNNSTHPIQHSTLVEIKNLNDKYFFTNEYFDLLLSKDDNIQYPFTKEYIELNSIFEVKTNDCLIYLHWNLSSDESKTISINPNPARNFIELKFNNDEFKRNIDIYNELGQLVRSFKNIEPNTNSRFSEKGINVSDLSAGKYFVNIFKTDNQNPVLSSSFVIIK